MGTGMQRNMQERKLRFGLDKISDRVQGNGTLIHVEEHVDEDAGIKVGNDVRTSGENVNERSVVI